MRCKELQEINFSSFKTDNLTNMSFMFSGCSSLKEINLTTFKTDKVTDMKEIFYDVLY
jgi:surface protein